MTTDQELVDRLDEVWASLEALGVQLDQADVLAPPARHREGALGRLRGGRDRRHVGAAVERDAVGGVADAGDLTRKIGDLLPGATREPAVIAAARNKESTVRFSRYG